MNPKYRIKGKTQIKWGVGGSKMTPKNGTSFMYAP